MPVHESARQRAVRRARTALDRLGDELRIARVSIGLSARQVGRLAGVSHTQVRRIELGTAPRVDVDVLARLALAVGCELSMRLHPVGPPVRDKAHISLLGRFAARLHHDPLAHRGPDADSR